jgi:hypothetical protein
MNRYLYWWIIIPPWYQYLYWWIINPQGIDTSTVPWGLIIHQ